MIVVISQSATNDPNRRDHEEQLVAHLLLEAKCEVNLVPDLSALGEDTTGLLCLEGIKGDMALLSWHGPQDAHALLESHGIHGRLGNAPMPETQATSPPQGLGPGVYDAMQRTVHHVQLDLQHTGPHYEAHIKALARDAATTTVSLGGPPVPATAKAPATPNATPASTPEKPADPAPGNPSVAPVPKRSSLYEEADSGDSELDDLLDRLDEADL